MPVIPLKQLSYADASDTRRIVDAINANFRYLDWLINSGNVGGANIDSNSVVEAINQALAQYQSFIDAMVGQLSIPLPQNIDFQNEFLNQIAQEYFEYGSADWSSSGVEFTLENGYTNRPVAVASVEADDPSDFDTADFQLVIKYIQETVAGVPDCYSRVQVVPKGSGVPASPTGAKISLYAVCTGVVFRI